MSQRVFITGATGFVGSRLAARLVSQDVETHICIRPISNLWRIKNIQSNLHVHHIDLLDEEKIKSSIQSIKPDCVFHFACYGGFPEENNDTMILNTNINSTLYLLNACKQLEIKRFIYVGSSSEYGLQSVPMTEDLRETPVNVYGISKLTATHLTQLYAQQEKLQTTILRIFSPYGPFDDPKRLIPSMIRACLEKKSLPLGSGKQVRDFVYIEDLINAFLMSVDKAPGKGEIINLGFGKQYAITEVVNTILDICGHPIDPLWNSLSDRINEPKIWVANRDKAAKMLNWQPQTSLRAGLTATVNWTQQRLEKNESF